MSTKEMNATEVQTTTHYWGYRELDASELKHVGGGDDGGDYGDYGGCDFGGYGGLGADDGAGISAGYGTEVADPGVSGYSAGGVPGVGASVGVESCLAADYASPSNTSAQIGTAAAAIGVGINLAAATSPVGVIGLGLIGLGTAANQLNNFANSGVSVGPQGQPGAIDNPMGDPPGGGFELSGNN